MRPKTAFYTALGFVTYRVGKVYAKRRVKKRLGLGRRQSHA
jgi:hypothetical protein